jgi:LysM repeat protein
MSRKLSHIIAIFAVAIGLLVSAGAASAQQVTLPYCTYVHTVQRGETLWRISRIYGTTVASLQQVNGLGSSTRIFAGQQLCVQGNTNGGGQGPVGGRSYVVVAGDTLARIARQFGFDLTVLARVNNIVNPNRIYAGQILMIPDFTIQ